MRRGAAAGGATLGAAALLAPAADAGTFTVTNLADSAEGSLRDAIGNANTSAGIDLITFQTGLTGTITLTSGDIEINEGVEVQGPGADVIEVDGAGGDRIFHADTDVAGDQREPVTISGLTLTNGRGVNNGGAILAYYTNLSVADSVVSDNDADSNGGAIYLYGGSLTIARSIFSENDAVFGAGAVYVDGPTSSPDPDDDVLIADSVFTDNHAGQNGGAAYFDDDTGGDVVIERSTFAANDADDRAGAIIFYGPQGAIEVRESTISGNLAGDEGGGLFVLRPTGDVTFANSTISDNESTDEAGGGIYLDNRRDVDVTVANSTVVGNAAETSGGGIYRYASENVGGDDTVTLSSTIVADNSAGNGPDLFEEPTDPVGSFELGFSLVEDTAGATITETPAGTNLLGVGPQLGPLAANGGSTPTHLPAATSPALDAGIANGLVSDQRGLVRTVDQPDVPGSPSSDATDIGAVELGPSVEPAPELGPCRSKQVLKLQGSDLGDRIRGTGDPDLIVGFAGNDVLEGVGAADCIEGNEDRDTVKGGGGGDRLAGGDGNDRIRGQGASDRLAGQAGKDNLNGGGGRDRLVGGRGKDKLKGGPGRDKLKGGAGPDKLIGASSEKDKLNCGRGRDKVRVDTDDKVSKTCEKVVEVAD